MIIVLGIPGVWSSERLRTEFTQRGEEAVLLPAESFHLSLGSGGVHWLPPSGYPVLDMDRELDRVRAVVVKKLGDIAEPGTLNRLNILRAFEARGIPVFNTVSVIETLLDRQRMSQTFAMLGFPIPPTLVTESLEEALEWTAKVGDVIVKPLFTTKGRGMVRLSEQNEKFWPKTLVAFRENYGPPFYCQRFIDVQGKDIGVSVVNGEIQCAYYRVSPTGAWKTTTHAGGRYAPCEVTPEMEELVGRVHERFPTDFTTVDLAYDVNGFYYLYELSPFGGFRGSEESGGVNVAGLIADHVLAKVGKASGEMVRAHV